MKPLVLHEDAFYEYFGPYRHPEAAHNIWGGLGLETFGPDRELVYRFDANYVWTVVDGDGNGDMWITPGVQFVNRHCYLITKRPHHEVEMEFRCPRNASELTPLGLKRQLSQIQKAMNRLEQELAVRD